MNAPRGRTLNSLPHLPREGEGGKERTNPACIRMAHAWALGLLYCASFWLAGVTLSCLPCLACARRVPIRAAPCKWAIALSLVALAWAAPPALWFAYSPLGACGSRWVYSAPRDGGASGEWEPFWCARRCAGSPVARPASVAELQSLVANASRVRAVGGGHSSTDLQCNEGGLLVAVQDGLCSYEGLDGEVATFGAGCSVEDALRRLLDDGRQLRGFGGIAQQRLGGAVSTSLHGQHTTSFATHLVGLRAVLANGTILDSSDPALLDAWRGSMGRLGILVQVRLRTWPIEFVECRTRHDANASAFSAALRRRGLAGFEAKRLLSSDAYVVRTCEEVVGNHSRVAYEAKDSVAEGFLLDNVALPMVTLFGSTLSRARWFARFMLHVSGVATSRRGAVASVNDYRVAVSYNPHFDEEYAIPADRCHAVLEEIGRAFAGLHVHAFVRRVDADAAWLSWAPVDSCAVRLEYFDYNRIDFVRYERRFRLRVEEIVLAHNGSGHRGKIWYRSGRGLLAGAPRRAEFEAYRASLDPSGKFENAFTREMRGDGERTHEVLPHALEVRAFAYRLAVWAAVGVNAAAALLLCALCGRRIHATRVRARPKGPPGPPAAAPSSAARVRQRERVETRRRR